LENITTLCTSNCADSLREWLSTVEGACDEQLVSVNNLIVEPKALPLKYIAAHDIVCLQDRFEPRHQRSFSVGVPLIFTSSENYCFYESQDWEEGALMQ
jgi:hypothetical protein